MTEFKLVSPFGLAGDQPKAVASLTDGFTKGNARQTLLGVTGSGKTFSVAHVIQKLQKPTLVLTHNKTLTAQLYNEFKEFFPENAVEYFVSYFDYYQPESYIAATDTYIEKDSAINEKIEQLRLRATMSLATRKDVIIVASVSCIYGLGDPAEFKNASIIIKKGMKTSRSALLAQFVALQYERNDMDIKPGTFRVKGDTIDLIPGYSQSIIRFELFGDEVDAIYELHEQKGTKTQQFDFYVLFPARHFVVADSKRDKALSSIRQELEETLPGLDPLIAHRLKTRVKYDTEMIQELGYCTGIENYSRHFDGRKTGEPPFTLIDFFPKDFLLVVDESHVSIPQIHGMWKGDYSRKKALVDYGFRLPSAFDNRPLRYDEFDKKISNVLYVSATPSDYELKVSQHVAEQIVRPTGLVDPQVICKPKTNQMADLLEEIQATLLKKYRVLVTTLTKRMAENLSEYLAKQGVKVRYLHSEIETLERNEIIRQLRLGTFDVLVGINLLREGLDIPEVALVAILDADKEGFLRDARSLIQTCGRAARNVDGRVILYADTTTGSMQRAMEEMSRRRTIQLAYNTEHGITPQTIIKPIREQTTKVRDVKHIPQANRDALIEELTVQMNEASESLDFERAIDLRDQIHALRAP